MMLLLLLLLPLPACLGTSHNHSMRVRWCVTSCVEGAKCAALSRKSTVFSCVRKSSTKDCLAAITADKADAITLDGGSIYTAGMKTYNLQPIIAEDYGTASETCYYAIAVAKKGTEFGLNDLKGKRSCHTGLGKSAGWNIPIGTLVSMGALEWGGVQDGPLEKAVSEYFQASCVPGAQSGSNLCKQCKGDCSKARDPYSGYSGALRCLAEDAGDVAFIKHLTIPESEQHKYELLCKDGSRAPVSEYMRCHLAKVPAHAVVSRKDEYLADFIYNSLTSVKDFNLFSSTGFGGEDLMFKDNTKHLVRIPPNTDSYLYLGAEYTSIIYSLTKESTTSASDITWCAVGPDEKEKCERWQSSSAGNDGPMIKCQSAPSVDDCLKKILSKEADAMAVDGGQVYTAGKCGLIPAMAEQYYEENCHMPGGLLTNSLASALSYYAVAVVKKSSGLTWDTLNGMRSCHTGIGRTAGWNMPMGQVYNTTGSCNFTEFFPSGCAPGADPSSSFCENCVGSGTGPNDKYKCQPNSRENYNGYDGAFRCLVEEAGDVAFVKHNIVEQYSDGNGPDWALSVSSADYALVCPGMDAAVPISEYKSCNLGFSPSHAVVTRPESHNDVVCFLRIQQAMFGVGTSGTFQMFSSVNGKNLLFKDSTQCLQEVPAGTSYVDFLGPGYVTAVSSLRECGGTISDLERSCTFHSCQQKY